jgi:hypothetical protein
MQQALRSVAGNTGNFMTIFHTIALPIPPQRHCHRVGLGESETVTWD